MEKDILEIKNLVDSIHYLRIGMKQFVQKKIREDKIDITYEMLQVMGVLWGSGELNQQEIADSIQKNKASLTSLLDNLAKRGLIVRTEDASDRRNKIISLTKSGFEFQAILSPLLEEFYHTLQQGLNIKDINKTSNLLRDMTKNLTR